MGKKIQEHFCLGVLLLAAVLLSGCAVGTEIPFPTPLAATATGPAPAATAQAGPSATLTPLPTNPPKPPISTATSSGIPFEWKQIAGGLTRPSDLADPGDKSGALLVLEQIGKIRILQNGMILADPLLDITDRVGSQGNEQGLLGIALDPKYIENGYFYVNYTDLSGNTVIARFQAGLGLQKADPGSEKVLLRVKQPFPNHNGGSMVFGPDGYLYMGLGDGGSSGDPNGNAQSLNTLLGKLLRIDIRSGNPYAIPKENPLAAGGGLKEIWAYGLRNPWRFSFDLLNGDLYIADVGQNLYEEIDYLPSGSPGGVNFGWNFREGLHPYTGTPPSGAKFMDPIYEYGHDQGCSIIGGFVYRGQTIPELNGIYIYGDYCNGQVWGLQKDAAGKWQNQLLAATHTNISSFGQDLSGELYLLDTQGGRIYKLVKN